MKIPILAVLFFIFSFPAKAQQLEWAQSLGGIYSDIGFEITTDASGNVYTVGKFYGPVDFDPGPALALLNSGLCCSGMFIKKTDANGNFIWAKQVTVLKTASLYSGDINPCDIIVDKDTNIFIAGQFRGTVDFDPGTADSQITSFNSSYDLFILKLNSDGEFIAVDKIYGVNSMPSDIINIDADQFGNIYAASCHSRSVWYNQGFPQYSPGFFLQKYDRDLKRLWFKPVVNYQSFNSETFAPRCISVVDSNNIVVTGDFTETHYLYNPFIWRNLISEGKNDVFVLRLSDSGKFVEVKQLGTVNEDHLSSFAINKTNGDYYLVGRYDIDKGGSMFIQKRNVIDSVVWTKFAGDKNTVCREATLDAAGNLCITGSFIGTVDMDPGAVTTNITSPGNEDIFMAILDSAGNLVKVTTVGSSGVERVNGMCRDAFDAWYITGYFFDSCDFNPESQDYHIFSKGINDAFVAKYSLSPNGIEHITRKEPVITAYPNPSSGRVYINAKAKITSLAVTDMVGRELIKTKPSDSNYSFDLDTPGIYFLSVTVGDHTVTQKIIIR